MKYKTTPPDMLLVLIIFEILVHYIFPIKKLILSPYNYIGILFILIGIILNFGVGIYFRKLNTTLYPYGKPRVLVTSGIFSISRNPLYLGMALTLIGVAILLGSITPFLAPILFIILTDRLTIPVEEKNLEKKFGKKYLDYKKKVRRWI